MKMTFKGWQRQVYAHEVEVMPVSDSEDYYSPAEHRRSLTWSDGMTALGKVTGLALSGAFLVEFRFTKTELRRWLTAYLLEHPEEALQLIATSQGDAMRALARGRAEN